MNLVHAIAAFKKARNKHYYIYQANPRKRTGDVVKYLTLCEVLKAFLFKQHDVYVEIGGFERR